ncbi:hypothetical protein B0181_07960 [Moraxella caviae]|uniref:Uncharacterized protein n=1 Tax=Moraxella caviae TaxID=34060 RepID=A0A1S9ZYR1_9GAMM|nr:hypothetical protein [Moraxella caviae]OOR88642.1 hypothetical protein B0181_07960 [Moraxella caviae]STZ13674.1 Uncharacterised protein [Moraxella caviae]
MQPNALSVIIVPRVDGIEFCMFAKDKPLKTESKSVNITTDMQMKKLLPFGQEFNSVIDLTIPNSESKIQYLIHNALPANKCIEIGEYAGVFSSAERIKALAALCVKHFPSMLEAYCQEHEIAKDGLQQIWLLVACSTPALPATKEEEQKYTDAIQEFMDLCTANMGLADTQIVGTVVSLHTTIIPHILEQTQVSPYGFILVDVADSQAIAMAVSPDGCALDDCIVMPECGYKELLSQVAKAANESIGRDIAFTRKTLTSIYETGVVGAVGSPSSRDIKEQINAINTEFFQKLQQGLTALNHTPASIGGVVFCGYNPQIIHSQDENTTYNFIEFSYAHALANWVANNV